jgi:hypothetical protein
MQPQSPLALLNELHAQFNGPVPSQHREAVAAASRRYRSLSPLDQHRALVASQRQNYAADRAATRYLIKARWEATRGLRRGTVAPEAWLDADRDARFHARWSKSSYHLLRRFEAELAALEDLTRRETAARDQVPVPLVVAAE